MSSVIIRRKSFYIHYELLKPNKIIVLVKTKFGNQQPGNHEGLPKFVSPKGIFLNEI